MSPNEFYSLITNGGEVAPFNDSQIQRLAHLFSGHDGSISFERLKAMIERLQDTIGKDVDLLKREREEEDYIQPNVLQNIFLRLNGFVLALAHVRSMRETYNSKIDSLKERRDSGMP